MQIGTQVRLSVGTWVAATALGAMTFGVVTNGAALRHAHAS